MITVSWGAIVTVKGSRGSCATGGPSLGAAVAEGIRIADYMQRQHSGEAVVVQISCECAMCSGTGLVKIAGRRAYATKPCPACKGKTPEAKSLEFEFEYLKERL